MIGVLYESSEWSDFKLAAELAARGCDVRMIDLAFGEEGDFRADALAMGAALSCDVLVSRIFASAVFRGHGAAHGRMAQLAPAAESRGIALVNPARAHFFEIDKRRVTETLAKAGVDVPRIQACGRPAELLRVAEEDGLSYPCIVKPNCGGRTTLTAVARTADEAHAFLEGLAAASDAGAPAASPFEPPAAPAAEPAAGTVVPLALTAPDVAPDAFAALSASSASESAAVAVPAASAAPAGSASPVESAAASAAPAESAAAASEHIGFTEPAAASAASSAESAAVAAEPAAACAADLSALQIPPVAPTAPDSASMAFLVEDYLEPERGFITRVELVDGEAALVVARSVVAGGLSAYHLGSTYELYDNCPGVVRAAALAAGRALGIGFGSFDIVENGGRAYVIDANSVSNVSPDNTETFGGFDLMAAYADAIARIARSLPACDRNRAMRAFAQAQRENASFSHETKGWEPC